MLEIIVPIYLPRLHIDLDPKFDKLFDDLFNRFTHGKYYDLFPDVTPTLEFLKKNGFKTGVISNTDERLSTYSLQSLFIRVF